jgi:TPR repeat protein
MLSPSDIVVRPASLAERLAAEAKADQPTLPDPTPTTMAERFAPEGQRNENRLTAEPPMVPGMAPERTRAATPGRWLLVASILVSLVPTAIILMLLWQGAIRLPGSPATPIVINQDEIPERQQASMAVVPAVTAVPTVAIAAKPEIVLSAPGRIKAKSGEDVDFDIAIDSAESLPARSIIAVRAMPDGASFSQGRAYDETEWNLRPDEIGDLKLRLPKSMSGTSELRVELMAADGTVLASATTALEIAADPKSALILRSDETERVEDLIEHGQKMIDVGYFAGARAYFKRAAEAGSGEAALQLGATYDPDFIDQIGAQGIKGDPDQAQTWYERAKQLGVEGAEAKLEALKKRWTNGGAPVQATEAESTAPAPAEVEAETEAADAADTAEAAPQAAPTGESAPLLEGKEEWVALVGFANVRAAPSSTADTLRVAEKGARLKVTGRKGNWVQVSDPETDEVGWIYSRYIETAQSPAR